MSIRKNRQVVVRGLLVSAKPQTIHLRDIEVHFGAGETIHTENSYKYDLEEFNRLAVHAGWCRVKTWTDEKQYFSVQHFEQARHTGNGAEHHSNPRSVTFRHLSSTQEEMP